MFDTMHADITVYSLSRVFRTGIIMKAMDGALTEVVHHICIVYNHILVIAMYVPVI